MKIELHDVFCSRGMTKVLHKIVLCKEINITQLTRETGLNHIQTKKYLKILVSLGLVEEKRFGRIRIFRCKMDNKYMKLLSDFIEAWERISN